MGGVDHVSQRLHNVSPLQKVYKWYKKLAFRIIMQMILNVQKIYVGYTGAKMPFQNFLKTVITSWITIERDPQPEHIVLDETVSRLTGHHFPGLLLPKPDAKDQQPSKRCGICYKKNIKTDHGTALKTRYICITCPSQPVLHPDKCFELHHTKHDFVACFIMLFCF